MARKGLKNTKVRIAAIGTGLAIGATVITGVASASVGTQETDPNRTRFQSEVDCEIVVEEDARLTRTLRGEVRNSESQARDDDLPALEEECAAQSGVVLDRRVVPVLPDE